MTDISSVLSFLTLLKTNNNKLWFDAHRECYIAVREEFEAKVEEFIAGLTQLDERIASCTVKGSTYRINRDTRFSADKTPYKTHLGAYVNAYGKHTEQGGYYMHLEPGNCMIAGGAYCLSPKVLKAVRQSIVDNVEEYASIVEQEKFKQAFPVIGMNRLKTIPKGFSKDFSFPQYIQPKDYSIACRVDDDFFFAKDWLKNTMAYCQLMQPFLNFINLAIDEYLTESI